MSTWSSTELGTDVLKRLGIVGAGQTAAYEDLELVTTSYTSIYRRIRAIGIAPWSAEEIPDEAKDPLSRYVAGQVVGKFGITGQRRIDAERDGEAGKHDLHELYSADKPPLAVRAVYF